MSALWFWTQEVVSSNLPMTIYTFIFQNLSEFEVFIIKNPKLVKISP
jgi:hypothetical protein